MSDLKTSKITPPPQAQSSLKINGMKDEKEDWGKYFSDVLNNKDGLNSEEIALLKEKLKEVENTVKDLEELRLKIGRILDYDNLKKDGASSEDVLRYSKEDDTAIENADNYTKKIIELRKHMFGYPANMQDDSAVTKYFRFLETKHPFINECGDAYEKGFYAMDAKVCYEIPLLNKIYKHLGLQIPEHKVEEVITPDGKKERRVIHRGPWGYITQGGSESNLWGIMNGVRKYPNGIVYYSTATHYSVSKAVGIVDVDFKILKPFVESVVIPTYKESEAVDVEILIEKIKENWEKKQSPAIILLTWGTTKKGDIDDVETVCSELKKLNIPYYLHLDAAMYGGISQNQKNAPVLPNASKLDINSVSISLHKYFGNTNVNSIVISKVHPETSTVDYIGMADSTTCGSRSFNPCSSLQRVVEVLERKNPLEYDRNVKLFETLLKKNKVSYKKAYLSNTFVIKKPVDDICKQYQLSIFKEEDGQDKAHIIIFPYHDKKTMEELAEKLGKNQK